MPYKTKRCKNPDCIHLAREHNRSRKSKGGIWTGRCLIDDCKCREYLQ